MRELTDPKHSVVYQIYPSSFQDSNGDGIGDLKGITARLGYLARLGIDYIWLSPFYPSPQADGGYDIADYCAVDPRYGTLEDFKVMTAEARKYGIGVVIDLVMNHTSIEHPWFKEARSSADNPKRSYYTWATQPNNWESLFGGSSWEQNPADGAYYLHTFLPEQPDLNWDNPAVRQEFTGPNGILEFWAKLGVTGFRCDAIWWLSKNPSLADDVALNPDYTKKRYPNPWSKKTHENSQGWKNLFTYVNEVADKAADLGCFLLTEGYPRQHFQLEDYLLFYRNGRPNSRPMMFELMEAKWRAKQTKKVVDEYQTLLQPEDVPSYVLGNHDTSRIATRAGRENAKAAMTLLLMLPGQPVMYNGDELGMTDTKISFKRHRDHIDTRLKNPKTGRDPQRTPMQWNNKHNAGFSRANHKELWLPVNKNYKRGVNAAQEANDAHSILNHTRQLLALRRRCAAIREGQYRPYDTGRADMFGFERILGDEIILVVINLGKKWLPLKGAANAAVLSSTQQSIDKDWLAPHEARVLQKY